MSATERKKSFETLIISQEPNETFCQDLIQYWLPVLTPILYVLYYYGKYNRHQNCGTEMGENA